MSSPGKFKRSTILNFSTVVKNIMIYLLKPSLSVDYISSENILQLQILPTVMEGEAFIFHFLILEAALHLVICTVRFYSHKGVQVYLFVYL